MDFEFTEEQNLFRMGLRKFFKKEVTPEYVRQCDEKEEYPFKLMKDLGELGYWGIHLPEEYGGGGGNVLDHVILLEEIGYHFFALAQMHLRTGGFGGRTVLEFGNEEQKKTYLPKIAKGEYIFALGLTEPNAGSDASAVKTKAEKLGNKYILNGQKVFCTGAHISNAIIVLARTDPHADMKHKGLTTFIVDPKSKGVQIKPIPKMGTRTVHSCEVFFEDVEVPAENILGKEGTGWEVILSTLDMERISLGALTTAGAQRAIDDALEYAKQREQFGRPIGKFQVIQHKFADMQIEVNASRLLTYYAAWKKQNGYDCKQDAAICKVHATETFLRVTSEGVQIMGAYGYSMEYDMQRYFRDAKLFPIGGGTSEIQRNIIAKTMGL